MIKAAMRDKINELRAALEQDHNECCQIVAAFEKSEAELRAKLAELEGDAMRYRWLVANTSAWSWQPARYNAEITSGFAHAGTGYLGYVFEDAVDAAMKVAQS